MVHEKIQVGLTPPHPLRQLTGNDPQLYRHVIATATWNNKTINNTAPAVA